MCEHVVKLKKLGFVCFELVRSSYPFVGCLPIDDY